MADSLPELISEFNSLRENNKIRTDDDSDLLLSELNYLMVRAARAFVRDFRHVENSDHKFLSESKPKWNPPLTSWSKRRRGAGAEHNRQKIEAWLEDCFKRWGDLSTDAKPLLDLWLATLKKEGLLRLHVPNAGSELTRGIVDRLCRDSAILCLQLAARLVQGEFDEKSAGNAEAAPTSGLCDTKAIEAVPAVFPQGKGLSSSLGVQRAILVEKIRREIVEISQRTALLEDYDDNIRGGKGHFSSFVTVSVCDQHNDLCDKLCAVKETKKPKIVYLACEIAARSMGNGKPVLPKTLLDAHKRHGAEARKFMDVHFRAGNAVT